MNRLFLLVSLCLIANLGACLQDPAMLPKQNGAALTNKSSSTSQAVATTTERTGAERASLSANATLAQEITVSDQSAIAGTTITFPPGSLSISTDITIEESVQVATANTAAELGLGDSFGKVGAAVSIQPVVRLDPAQPFTVSLTIPDGASLSLTDALSTLLVIYKVQVFAENKTVVGIIPRSELVVDGKNVSFKSSYFGAFQSTFANEVFTDPKQVVSATQIQTKQEVANLPQISVSGRSPFIVGAGQTVEISGANFRPTMRLAMGGTSVSDLKVLSDVRASFTAPSNDAFGLTNLTADQDGTSQTVSLFYKGSKTDLPVSTFAETDVCSGVRYYDAGGVIRIGKKSCGGPDLSALTSDVLKTGVSVAGVSGALVPAPALCTSNGQVGCVTTAVFKAADLSNLAATNIKTGVVIAGITGGYSGVSISDCSSDGEINCRAIATYKAIDMTKISGSNIRSGITIAGITGQFPSYAFPLSYAGDGGVTNDLDSATFDGRIKSSAQFQWWDQAGVRHVHAGDPDIASTNIANGINFFGTTGSLIGGSTCTSDGQQNCVTNFRYKSVDTDPAFLSMWDIRAGKTVGGISGNLHFYKNMASTTLYNRNTGTASNASLDIYDTIDDYNNNGTFPNQNPWPAPMISPGMNWVRDIQSDSDMSNTCNGAEDCVYRDMVTHMLWSKDDATVRNWEASITYCHGLNSSNFGGYSSGWRLPAAKELLQAHIDGIWAKKTPLNFVAANYWSATTNSTTLGNAYLVTFHSGTSYATVKSGTAQVTCVR